MRVECIDVMLRIHIYCQHCPFEMESVLHVLKDCPLPHNVWNVIIKPSDREVLSSTGFIPWLISNLSSTASIPWLIMFGVVPWFLWKWRSKGVFGGDASLHSTPLNAKNPAARIHFSNESVLNLVVKKQAALTGWNTPPPPPPQMLLEREDFFETTNGTFIFSQFRKNLFYGIMYLFQSRKTYRYVCIICICWYEWNEECCLFFSFSSSILAFSQWVIIMETYGDLEILHGDHIYVWQKVVNLYAHSYN